MVLMSAFNTCPECGAVLFTGSRCWNCSPPRVMQPEEMVEPRPTFDLPEEYTKHLREVVNL